jgi:hypothetical protein
MNNFEKNKNPLVTFSTFKRFRFGPKYCPNFKIKLCFVRFEPIYLQEVFKYKSLFLFIAVLLNGYISFGQSEPKLLSLKGFVIGADTNNTIPLANIIKKPSGERFISNRYGGFTIQVLETDTLVFSVIGYQNFTLPCKKYVVNQFTDPIRVRMKPANYRLKDAEINYNQKRRDSLVRQAAKVLKTSPVLNNYDHYQSWISGSSGSVITDMFASSNKKLQQYDKLQRLIELYHEQQLVDDRYTPDLVMRATGLPETKVLEFKKYCNIPHYFILNSNDYELVLAIKSCYADFARQSSH